MPDLHTKLLLHGESLEDSGPFSVPITNRGVEISTAQSKFGSKSFYFDGKSALMVPPEVFQVDENNDFTIDLWCYLVGTLRTAYFLSSQEAGGFMCGANGVGRETIVFDLTIPNAAALIPQNRWLHYAAVRSNGVLAIYIDGKKVVQAENRFSYNSRGTSYGIGIRCETLYGTQYSFTGYIDEFRISDVARWTNNFAPPTEPYGPSTNLANNVLVSGTVREIEKGKALLSGTVWELRNSPVLIDGTIRTIKIGDQTPPIRKTTVTVSGFSSYSGDRTYIELVPFGETKRRRVGNGTYDIVTGSQLFVNVYHSSLHFIYYNGARVGSDYAKETNYAWNSSKPSITIKCKTSGYSEQVNIEER